MKPSAHSLFRYSPVHLLVAVILLLVSSPFVQDLSCGRLVEGVLFTIVVLSGLFAVSGRRSAWIGTGLAALALGSQWLSVLRPDWPPFFLVAAAAFVALVILRLLLYVLSSSEVNHETLCASVAGFLMIGILWSVTYTLLGRLDPAAFSFSVPGQTMDGFDAFYFSFVTLSTIGFGDITPVSRVARMLAVMEAITGMFYVAVLVARLVSLYSSRPPSQEEAPSIRVRSGD